MKDLAFYNRSMRILLAEDDDFLAGGIELALTNASYTIQRVKNRYGRRAHVARQRIRPAPA